MFFRIFPLLQLEISGYTMHLSLKLDPVILRKAFATKAFIQRKILILSEIEIHDPRKS